MAQKMIRAISKVTGTPRPELGALTQGEEYQVPAELFSKAIFERVVEPTKTKKKPGGDK